jgi:hypothetical protein
MHHWRRYRVLLLTLLPVLALVLAACDAKLLPQMSHQGRLTDTSGNPVPDGDYEVQYVIYNDDVAGTAVYTETQTIPVQDGFFTTALGVTDVMTPTIFAEPTWLEISIEGETLAPRQRLQGAPYAFSLASGAIVQGAESLDEGIFTMAVFNSDDSPGGGYGLIVWNTATPTGSDRDNVAALWVNSAGSFDDGTGSYGAVINSSGYRGLLAIGGEDATGTSGFYAAVFDSPAGIDITGGGGCSGCTLLYTARNVGDAPIRKGDFVAVEGVELDADFNVPVMQVRRATAAGASTVGVATGALVRVPADEVQGVPLGGYDTAGPTAAAGDYLSVAVQGLVQARAAAGATLQPGAAVSVNGDGVVAATGAGLARAMSAVDENGLVWVMVGSPAGQ